MAEVFISYPSRDITRIEPILNNLEVNGIKCWCIPRDIDNRYPYEEQVFRAVAACSLFVIVISKNTNQSVGSKSELNLAFMLQKPIISVKLEQTYLPFDVTYKLANSVELYSDYQYGLMNLRFLIKNRLNMSGASIGSLPPKSLDVFISCCERDHEKVAHLATKLKNEGFTSWIKPYHGEFYSDTKSITVEAVYRCSVVLVLVSKDYSHLSLDCHEVGIAIHHHIPIVVAFLEDASVPSYYERILTKCKTIHLYPEIDSGIWNLIPLIKEYAESSRKYYKDPPDLDDSGIDVTAIDKRVFISHSSKDYLSVEKYVDMLEKQGVSCWIAPRNIPYGANHAKVIPDAIRKARCMLVFISNQAQESEEIDKEIRLADNFHIPIIPIRLDSCDLRGSYSYHLINKQWLLDDCATDADFEKLIDIIQKM